MSPFHADAPAPQATAGPAPLAIDRQSADLLFTAARTAYSFTDEPVTDEQVRALHDLVKWGPTSMNGQPMRITLVRSAEARARLIPLLAPANRAKAESAPLVAILSYDVDFHDTFAEVFPHAPQVRDLFTEESARHRFGTFNGAMQAAYFLLGIRALGLAAGPMGGFRSEAVDAEFFPDGRQRSILVVNIGHPAPDAFTDRLPRLDYERVVSVV